MNRKRENRPESASPNLICQKIISTAELPFAAYIKTRYRLPLLDIKKSSNGRVTWDFEQQDKDEATLANEFCCGGQVPATEYFSELKILKSTTYTL